VVSWGGTYGAIYAAVTQAQREGKSVAHAHLRYLNPFPRNLGDLLKRYKQVLVPELNLGQLSKILKYTYDLPIEAYTKIQGQPFKIREISAKINEMLG
jgi:2-oxoglutarate ferredoxin oxidoreductase subunit alpha